MSAWPTVSLSTEKEQLEVVRIIATSRLRKRGETITAAAIMREAVEVLDCIAVIPREQARQV